MKKLIYFVFISFLLDGCHSGIKHEGVQQNMPGINADSTDPLPSWNDGILKQSIISYVTTAADSNSKKFIPAADRIATLDNDGKLWAEKPLVQEVFAYCRVKKMVVVNPALASQQPFKAVIENDKEYFHKGGEKALIGLAIATHTGMSEDAFKKDVNEFMSTGTYPGKNMSFKKITYQRQIELLNYLRANGFKTFICSGGTTELIRNFSQEYYGIPKEQVVGTSFQYLFVDSNRIIFRKSALNSFNDKESKPVNIQLHIGQRPVFACGNKSTGGDIAMLKYSQSSSYPSFQLCYDYLSISCHHETPIEIETNTI